MAKQELGPNQRAAIAALRSGEYRKCKGRIARMVNRVEHNCPLGVFARLAGCKRAGRIHISYDGKWHYAPAAAVKWLGLRDQVGTIRGRHKYLNFLVANDGFDATFAEIADFMEQHPEACFTGPR